MTDEQIKQNADKYADKLYEDGRRTESAAPTIQEIYIAGAHSRDEEIEERENRYRRLEKSLRGIINGQIEEINKLSNPWISVKDRLPKKLENDCTSDYVLTRIDGPRQVWYIVNRYDYDIKAWKGCSSNTTHWMPIHKLKKGE